MSYKKNSEQNYFTCNGKMFRNDNIGAVYGILYTAITVETTVVLALSKDYWENYNMWKAAPEAIFTAFDM
jgi:hypothetical protein